MTAIELERTDVAPAPAPAGRPPRRRLLAGVAITGVVAGVLATLLVQLAQTRNTATTPTPRPTAHQVHVTTAGGDCSILRDGAVDTQIAGQIGGGCVDDLVLTNKAALIEVITDGAGPNSCSIVIDGVPVSSANGTTAARCSYQFRP